VAAADARPLAGETDVLHFPARASIPRRALISFSRVLTVSSSWSDSSRQTQIVFV
jgi:hypothetical protein